MNKKDQPECAFDLNERVKLSREALRYAKDPAQLQVWKKDRGEVSDIRWIDGDNFEGYLIRVSFSDEYLSKISFTEEQLHLSDD